MSLYPTKTRQKLLAAIDAHDGGVYAEAGKVWLSTGGMATERAREAMQAGWIRVATPEERTSEEWSDSRVYYRLTDAGRAAMRRQT